MAGLTLSALFFSLILFAGCSKNENAARVAADEATAQLNTWLDAEFEEYLDFYPQTKTSLGIKTDYDRLNDVSLDFRQRVLEWRRASVEEMRTTFDRDALDEQGKISWDLWIYLLERAESAVPFWEHDTIFGWRGPHTSLPRNLINHHKVDSVEDLDAYLARIKQVDRQMGQYLDRARSAYAKGIRTTHSNYTLALKNSQQVINGAPFNNQDGTSLWKDINTKIGALIEAGVLEEEAASNYRAKFQSALLDHVAPVYTELVSWLREAREEVGPAQAGAWILPDGLEYYQNRLERITTLSMNAQEIHNIGRAEVKRIHEEMNAIRKAVGFDGDLKEFFVFMREDEQFYYPSDDQSRAAYIRLAEDYLAAMETKLPEYFDLLPKADLEVRRVESFREQPGGAAQYLRGTPDRSRPGVFYMHLIDMSAHPVYRIENVAYHEGLPGHHLQISIQQELENVPRFRGYHGYTAYSEGWGLYSEYLAKDMGFYENPYNDFGRLSGELWRAIRLVVDTGIHAMAWSEQQAIDYALANSAKSVAAARSEIYRYVYMPGQATAYKLGMLKILELRQRAQDTLGSAFDYREFHTVVLGGGQLPMSMLEARVDSWLASKQKTRQSG